MKKIIRILACFILCWAALAEPVKAEADEPVMPVYYFQRPPYYMKLSNGKAGGFLVDITEMIFNQAGIPHQFVELPPKRILKEIEQNKFSCSIGWFKNSERETFALFSDVIYQSRPTIVVMRLSSMPLFPEKPTLDQVLKSSLALGIISGFSYGPVIDAAISSIKPTLYAISGDPENLLNMIYNERLDYVFMAPEEANYILHNDFLLKTGLRTKELADEPQGDKRYLMFSKGAGQELIDRINAAIQIVQQSDKYLETVLQVDQVKR